MTKDVVLAGNAVTAAILSAYLAGDSRYRIVACTVDDEYVGSTGLDGVPTVAVSRLAERYPHNEVVVIMAIGYSDLNRGRAVLFGRLKDMGYRIETYVHPSAHVFTAHVLGEGSVILPGAVVEPHARIGVDTMVWCNATLAHHSRVGDHCWIASGAVISGMASVERNSFIGVNATIVNDVTVSESTVVGGGALITKDTKPDSVHLARSAEVLRFSATDYVKHFGV